MAELVLLTFSFAILFAGVVAPQLSFLGFILLVIAILYSGYRFFHARIEVCPKCGAQNTMIPVDSPKGQKLYKQLHQEQSRREK